MLTSTFQTGTFFLERKKEKRKRKKDAEEGHALIPTTSEKTTNKGHFLILLNVSESYFIRRNNVDSCICSYGISYKMISRASNLLI